MLEGLNRGFGVLTFDGTQQYFALDGQHRLRAIKDSIIQNPELLEEDICVLMVVHYDTKDGCTRTRRLFTNINRNAKITTGAENIVLDEDDWIAILTRRFLIEHEFLKQPDRMRVISKRGSDGELTLSGSAIPKTSPAAFTSITVLYDILKYMAFDQPMAMRNPAARPNNDLLDSAYDIFSKRIDDLLRHCGGVRKQLENSASARDVRAPKDAEGEGNAFMRPVVQKAVARAVEQVMTQGTLTWGELMARLSKMN